MDVTGTAMKGVGMYITAGLLCETMRMTNNSYKRMSRRRTYSRPVRSSRRRRR